MIPRTYLSVAPSDVDSMCGREFDSTTLIKGLRRINRRISYETPGGYSAVVLWLGAPKEGKKICTFRGGAVPEFTQLGSGGTWMVRGWRSIFEKVIAARAATRRQIERRFGVVLEADGSDGSCIACRKEGVLKAAENRSKRLCSTHQEAQDNFISGEERRTHVAGLVNRLTDRRYAAAATKEINECLSSQ